LDRILSRSNALLDEKCWVDGVSMAEAAQAVSIEPANAVDRAIEALSKFLSVAYALSVAVTIYDVILDVVFSEPTIWVYDVVTTLIAVAFLIGGSYALMRREHIRITALYDLYPKRFQLIADLITSVLAIVYFVAFSWFAWKMASLSVANWEVGGSVWRQPTPVVVKVSMLIGVLLMIVQMISNMLSDLKALKAGA
jgi:TRAP-type mannitol/chloroaromatic compound transport system permease small subunit